jgi:glucose-1-phosphatase
MAIHSEIKTLIFDLGGVILDLSVDTTLQAFAKVSGIPKQEAVKIFHESPGFNEYEKGGMDDASFRQYLKKIYSINVSDKEIDTCWNAMLLGLPRTKLDLLKELQTHYNVLLLSNTNEIHLSYINSEILPTVSTEKSLDHYFHRAYYSHRMGMRKPDAEIFEFVLKENDLKASETLFLDDNAMNVAGASSVGIKTVHVTTPDLILAYFDGTKRG